MENKNNDNFETNETSDVLVEEEKKENAFKRTFGSVSKKFKKSNGTKLKNDALLRKGGYSLIITALVLAGLILFNWFIGVLAARYHLDFDMTPDKQNSFSKENIEYIESVENDVNITVFCDKDYYSQYIQYYYSLTADADYFTQAAELIDMYPDYNKKIHVTFLNPQSTEYTAFTKNYSTTSFNLCDVFVTSTINGNERTKLLTVEDLFNISESQSSYYYTSQTVTSSKVETAVTSAIDYVTNAEVRKIALLTGHSSTDYTTRYTETLERNNYEVEVISDSIVSDISDEYDTIAIVSPTIDFGEGEISAISSFLDNNGKLGKGLVYFADATSPQLPNLASFLRQWGIDTQDGVVFETSGNTHVPNNPTAIVLYPADIEDDTLITSRVGSDGYSITDHNLPMLTCTPASTDITTTVLVESTSNCVIAPVGVESNWAQYTDEDKGTYAGVIQAVQSKWENDDESDENNHLLSYVMAFSSVEFIESSYAQYYTNSNEDVTVLCTGRASHIDINENTKIFTAKIIENEMFTVTESQTTTVKVIFIYIIPIVIIAAGIFIYVRRRNAR